jgi:hypothetical protein
MDWPIVSSDAHQQAQAEDLDPPQAYASGCDLARLVSIREMDALASMVITALPFPPLPLMVLQGTDGEGATASSFDRIFGEHFRLFFVENYPTCSRDLRFEPMGSVPRTHLVMQQAASHTRASMIMAAPPSGVDSPAVEFARYEDVVKHYALDLGTLSDS